MRRFIFKSILPIIILPVLVLAGLFFLPARESSDEIFPNLDKNNSWLGAPPAGRLSKQNDIAPAEPVRLLFFGDLMLDRQVGKIISAHNLEYLFSGLIISQASTSSLATSSLAVSRSAISSLINLASFDLVGANLEGAVTNSGLHYLPDSAYDFAFAPAVISGLKMSGFNFFNIANNHLSDQGRRGVAETKDNLNKLGLSFSGEVDAQISSSSVVIIERQQKKIALIGLSMVYHDFDLTAAQELVARSKAAADLVVINIHWGQEFQQQFNKKQQAVGRALIEAGADVIIGHHPHVVQGMEIYRGRPIFYSLGNFIFDQYFSAETQAGLAVGLEVTSASTTISFFPLQSKASVVSLMEGIDREKFLKQYIAWSSLSPEQAAELSQGRLVLVNP